MPNQPDQTANPDHSKEEEEAILCLAVYFENKDRQAMGLTPARFTPEDISAENFKKAHAAFALFLRKLAERQAPKE